MKPAPTVQEALDAIGLLERFLKESPTYGRLLERQRLTVRLMLMDLQDLSTELLESLFEPTKTE